MPLVEMPNGEVVDVAEGTSSEVLARIKQQYAATVQSRKQRVAAGQPRKAPLTAEQQEVQKRLAGDKGKTHFAMDDLLRAGASGLTFGLADKLAAAGNATVNSVGNAVGLGNGRGWGEEYRISRDVEKARSADAYERAPILSGVGEIGGAILNPVGAGAKGLQVAGRGAQALGLERAAAGLTKAGTRIANAGPVAQAVLAGGNQGALNAAGHAENLSDVPGALLEGGAVGAGTGGAFGGALHLGARGMQIVRDALPRNAQQTAYSRIAELLEAGGTTPLRVQNRIASIDRKGGDAMVQDATPGLRAQAAAISRRPNVPSSNELIERGEQRIGQRQARYGEQIRDTVDTPAAGTDALARAEQLSGIRRKAGEDDYADGGVMDQVQFAPSKKIDDWFNSSPDANRLVRGAYDAAMREGRDPAKLFNVELSPAHTITDLPKGIPGVDATGGTARVVEPAKMGLAAVPTFRSFDYLKRAFDDEIGSALDAGKKQLAKGLSNHLNQLKGMLIEANPQYGEILKTQRDLFQQQSSLEFGQGVLKKLAGEPRQVMAELGKMTDEAKEEARIGIIDALVNTTKANPVQEFRNMSRTEPQRRVLEFAFGGTKEFRRFQRWVDREVRAGRSDVLTAPGRQSETSRIAMAADDDAGGATNILQNAMRGYAFGGAVGAMSGTVRTLGNISSGSTKLVQEEIAKILLSKGEDLAEKVGSVKSYRAARAARNKSRATNAAKGAQQVFTSGLGGE